MSNKILAVISVVVFSLLQTPVVHAAETENLQQAKDREAIRGLMWRYVRALDSLDAEAYVRVFTEDGEFRGGRSTTRGRAALKKMVEDLRQAREEQAAAGTPRPPMNHMITNAYIEFIDQDHARFHSYWMTVFGANGPDTSPRIAASGRGVDELVRVNGEWLIHIRDVSPQD